MSAATESSGQAVAPAVRAPVRNYLLLAPPIEKPGGRRRCQIWITSDQGRRAKRMNVRLWVLDDSGEWRPTMRGLAFGMDKAEALRDALIEACRRAGLGDE